MNPHPTLPALLLAAFTTAAAAQSAENFGPAANPAGGSAAPTPGENVRVEEIDKESESALMAGPSRYAGLDLENYTRAISASFSMRNRDIDPFARHQDPDFKPAQPVRTTRKIAKFTKEPVTPFSDIVARINITAVMPAQQTFLIGGRSFGVGDRLNLNIGKQDLLAIHVVGIGNNSVTFRHSVTSETAERVLGLMPDGMRRGTAALPPGVESPNSNEPIPALPGTALSSSRR